VIPVKDNMPTERFPFVTFALIVINLIVYLLAIRHGGSLFGGPDTREVVKYGAIPYAFAHPGAHCALATVPQATGGPPAIACSSHPRLTGTPTGVLPTWQTAFTAMFMQASILQLAGNMLFLWIFGNNVEDAMGPVKFLIFYILGGLAALALHVAIAPHSISPTIGAAGAIATVLGGYTVLYPRGRVLTFVFIPFFVTVIELPVVVMLGIWFAGQALFGALGVTNPIGGGAAVSFFAQIGGVAFGAATIRLLATRRKPVPPPRPAF